MFKPSEAFSLQVFTDDQAETDRIWNAIVGNGGSEMQCGWCKDKWGFAWQITPRALIDGMADPDPAARQARVRGDDEDGQDRHRRDRSGAAGLADGPQDHRRRVPLARRRDAGARRARRGPVNGFAHGGWLAPVGDEAIGEEIGTLFAKPFDAAARPADLRHLRQLLAVSVARQPDRRGVRRSATSSSSPVRTWRWNGKAAIGLPTSTRSPHSKAQDGPDLVIQGSSTLYPQLLERRLAPPADHDGRPGHAGQRQAAVRRRHPCAHLQAD